MSQKTGRIGAELRKGKMVEPNIKAALARRQLGTALALFLADEDPVSVHCLACGGGELADFLAQQAGATTFAQHALETHPDMKVHELVGLRNKYWNAMKHARTQAGVERDDQELLSRFDDEHNDHVLFVGWHDYASAVGTLPIEAQAFQVWYFANFPEKLREEISGADFESTFPGVRLAKRHEKKKMLRRAIARAKQRPEIMLDPKTERRELILERLAAPLRTN